MPDVPFFDAVSNGVAQHVFERRGNFLQHAAIDFDLAAGDFETDTLAQFFGSLPDDPVQTVGQTAGLHHAYRQQFLVEHVVNAQLGEQRGIGVVFWPFLWPAFWPFLRP